MSALLAAGTSDSPVADAAMQGDQDLVVSLVKNERADVNAAQADGMTALHWAASDGNAELAQTLIYAGANLRAATRVGQYTPLHLAARNGHADVVKTLLDAGADPKAPDAHGTTPLMLAAGSGDTDTIAALLDRGADVNAKESVRGETALMFAAAEGRGAAVKLLMDHGADWKASTKVFDWTKLPKTDPRLIAFNRPQGLAGAKAKSAAPAAQGGEAAHGGAAAQPATGAGIPAESARKPKPAAERGPSYADLVGVQGGLTALMFAARQGHADAVKALVEAGADVNQVDPGDHTSPLLIAIINGQFDTAKYLLDHGANPNEAAANGATPLYDVLNCVWAPKAAYPQPEAWRNQSIGYLDLVKALLEKGADPNVRLKKKVWYTGYNFDQSGLDETGATPFWRAAYADDIEAMKLLVAHGADPNIPTMNTPVFRFFDTAAPPEDKSGLPKVPVGGAGIPPLLAASGQAYGSSFTANHHRYAPTGMLAAVKYLVEELHADVNARDGEGNTALHNAAARGDNEMIRYLISKGADVKAINRKGQSVADMANGPFQRTQPFPETIALLKKLGVGLLSKCVSC
jgi:ankyrin repeat protein